MPELFSMRKSSYFFQEEIASISDCGNISDGKSRKFALKKAVKNLVEKIVKIFELKIAQISSKKKFRVFST